MATTAVFAEILVVGLQVEAWMALAFIVGFGTDWIDLSAVQAFTGLLTLLIFALAYVLGIIVDRLADTLLGWFDETDRGGRIKTRFSKNRDFADPREIRAMRLTVMHESEGISRFLEYQRSRWRIARATVVNLAIAGPLAILVVALRTDVNWVWALVLAAFTIVLIPVTYFAGVRIQDAWVAGLVNAYAILGSKSPQ